MQLERKSGTDLREPRTRAVGVELVPVVPEEDEVSLVVPGDDPALLKLRVLRKQAGQHAAQARAQHRVEVVEDDEHTFFQAARAVGKFDAILSFIVAAKE